NSTLQQEKAQKETEIVRLNKEKKDQQKQINSLQTEKSQLT
ncbi:15267_t:CDS:1, partial [Racocetra persica]